MNVDGAGEDSAFERVLLDRVVRAHELYLTSGDPAPVFDFLLDSLVSLSGSQYGFLDEVLYDHSGIYKLSLSLPDISWNEDSKRLREALVARQLEFRDLDNLAGAPAVLGETVIANEPSRHPRSRGVPPGHPPLSSYLGMPISFGGELVWVAGLANREQGYDQAMAERFKPLLATCGSVIHASRQNKRQTEYLRSLDEANKTKQALLDVSPESSFLIDVDGTVLDGNPTFARRLGLDLADIVGKSVFDFLPPDIAEARRLWCARATQQGVPQHFEDTKEGRTFRHHIYPVRNERGEVDRLAIFGADITEILEAQADRVRMDERFRTLIESTNEGVWAMDRQMCTTYVNQRMAAMLGYEAEEILGRDVSSFMPPEEHGDHDHHMRARRGGAHELYERTFARRDGARLTCLVSASSLQDAAGEFDGSIAFFTDITERKRMEAELADSVTKLRVVADHTYDWEYWLSPEGAFLYVSPACERVTGYTPEDFYADPGLLARIVHPQDAVDCGALEVEHHALDLRIVNKWGEVRWVGHVCQRVYDASGAYLGRRASNRDITERVRTEERMRALAEMVESAPNSITVHDAEGALLYVNRKALEMHGMTREQFLGMKLQELDVPQSAMHIRQRIETIEARGEATFEVGHHRGDGSVLPLEVTVKTLTWQGRPCFLSIGRDITERKAAEDSLRASEARFKALAEENAELLERSRRDAATKALLLDEVNHRVKNNLTVVIGLLYIQQRMLSSEARGVLGGTLRDLANRIETLAMAHNLLSAVQWQPLPLRSLVAQVLQAAAKLVPADKCFAHTHRGEEVSIPARLVNFLALALFELAMNTVKHALPDRDAVRVEVTHRLEGGELMIRYSDDGPGFSQEVLAEQKSKVGLHLVRTLVTHSLRGDVILRNEGGAVADLRVDLSSCAHKPSDSTEAMNDGK